MNPSTNMGASFSLSDPNSRVEAVASDWIFPGSLVRETLVPHVRVVCERVLGLLFRGTILTQ